MSVQRHRSDEGDHGTVLREWARTDGSLLRGPMEVRVWLADLDATAPPTAGALLSPEERTRAKGFADPIGRTRYAASRAILRVLLSRYAGEKPEELVVMYPKTGKPYLSSSRVKFNISHSQGLGLFAFARDVEVGVDIEREGRLPEASALGERFLPEGTRRGGFYRAWTMEEAALKCRGLGVSHMGKGHHPEARQMAGLHLHPIQPPGPYSAALAVEGSMCESGLVLFSWSGQVA